MPKFKLSGDEIIDRVATTDESLATTPVPVPETWDGEHVKVIRTGNAGIKMPVEGEEVIARDFEQQESSVIVSVPEEWAEETLKIVRTGFPLNAVTADTSVNEDDSEAIAPGTVGTQTDSEKQTHKQVLSNAIEAVIAEAEHDNGAPVKEVITKVTKRDMTENQARNLINSMRKKGELYEPKADHLRLT